MPPKQHQESPRWWCVWRNFWQKQVLWKSKELFIHIITAASTARNQPAGAAKAAPRDPTVMMRLTIFYEKNKFCKNPQNCSSISSRRPQPQETNRPVPPKQRQETPRWWCVWRFFMKKTSFLKSLELFIHIITALQQQSTPERGLSRNHNESDVTSRKYCKTQ